jgi:hypothetical protein
LLEQVGVLSLVGNVSVTNLRDRSSADL